MKTLTLTLGACAGLFMLLTGCATNALTTKQMEALTEVSVPPAQLAAGAYYEPDARKSPGAADVGGMNGGFIGSLVGSAIDAGVMANQQKRFEEAYGECFESIEALVPEDLAQRVERTLESALAADAFFGPRLVEEGGNQLRAEILALGLKRDPYATADHLTLGFSLQVELALLDPRGEAVFTRVLVVRSISSFLASEYVESPDRFETVVNESLAQLELSLAGLLDIKLGRTS